MSGLTVEVASSFTDMDAAEWNRLERGDFVFADHSFLLSLEEGKCLGRRTGWHPQILLLRERDELTAACVLFLKTNSYGEYIFDWAWANASERSGIPYYPKLTAAIPFTPATGPKILLKPNLSREERERATSALHRAAMELAVRTDSSSLHYLFTTPPESQHFERYGLAVRHSYQYHWRNPGWRDFDDFLSAFRSKRRAEIRRERQSVQRLPFRIETLTGDALNAEHAHSMHGFYSSTVRKMGGLPYLTSEFFELVFARMRNNILLVMAYDGTTPIAGALNFFSGSTLFGRHWGAAASLNVEPKNLHFEVCYYRAIDWALANGIELFEAGAQGEHKFNRGFTPSLCYSAHRLFHEPLHRAVESFIQDEKSAIEDLFADYRGHDPFKREQANEPRHP